MINLDKLIENAKKLDVKIIENAENPGIFLSTEDGMKQLDVRDMLQVCTFCSNEELNLILESNVFWIGEGKIKKVKPKLVPVQENEFSISEKAGALCAS